MDQEPATAAVASCHDVYFVSARGSGEAYAATGLRNTPELSAVEQGMADALSSAGSAPDIEMHQLAYPAPSVDLLLSGLNTGSLVQRANRLLKHNLLSYLGQERQGERELLTYLRQILATCAGSSKHPAVVLAGYSQGSMVVHNVLQALVSAGATAEINLIAGSVLVADPERMPFSQVPNFGTAPSALSSFGACPALDLLPGSLSCLTRGQTQEVPGQFLSRTVAVCDRGDLVCDTGSLASSTPAGYLAAAKAGVFIHVDCHDYCSASARAAGSYLASKLLGLGVGLAPLAVATQSLATGTVGDTYSSILNAQGGALPYVWSASPGALPPGLSLSSDGTLAGIPATAGSYSVPVTVTDSAGHTASGPVTITVNAPAGGLTVYNESGLAGIVSWVTGVTCPAPAPGDTMWVITQGAGQSAPDLRRAFPFPVYHGGAPVASSNDAVEGSATATITCSENSDSTSPAGAATVKSYSFTQTITGPTEQLGITTATDGGPPPRFTITDGGGCGTSPHGLYGVTIEVYDYSGQTSASLFTALAADAGGRWGPVTLTFPSGPATSWGVLAYCSIGVGQDNSEYDYPVAVVPVP
jgi:Putative Ig domain/Cutinase